MIDVQKLKQQSETRFKELVNELPTRKNENYRYTSLRKLDLDRTIQPQREIDPVLLKEYDGQSGVLLINALGATKFLGDQAELGLEISNELGQMSGIFENDVFGHLSVSRSPGFLSVRIEQKTQMQKPLKIVFDFDSQASAFFQPIQIEIGEGATASIVLEKRGCGRTNGKSPLAVIFTQITAYGRSRVNISEWNDFGRNVQDFSRSLIQLENGARVEEAKVFTGCEMLQYRQEINCAGENSEYRMDSAVRGESDQHYDFWIHSRHPVKNTKSFIEHWAVMADQAKAVFNGNMIISERGIGTEASQTNHNKLLSDQASINAIPKLEIATDDVKCAHGARVVPLDQNQLYYLMTRGITETESQRMLVDAFTDPVIEKIQDDELKVRIRERIQRKSAGDLDALSGGGHEKA